MCGSNRCQSAHCPTHPDTNPCALSRRQRMLTPGETDETESAAVSGSISRFGLVRTVRASHGIKFWAWHSLAITVRAWRCRYTVHYGHTVQSGHTVRNARTLLERYLHATTLIFAAGSKSPNLEKQATTLNAISGAPCAPVVRTGDAHGEATFSVVAFFSRFVCAGR
jgi:hypothetical protein